MTPYSVKSKFQPGETIPVPCGRCPACVARRVSGWSFRLMQQERVSSSAHFITLTYDTTHVPITSKRYMSLDKRDCQLFFKRLRKCNDNQIKYYLAGEYGGEGLRPHYHVILFNADIGTIDVSWSLGSVHYGQVTAASIGYTLKYISKPRRIPLHQNDDRLREFALMSKGLGANYINERSIRWHMSDRFNRMYLNIEDGKKIAMPRYYKEKLYNEHQRKAIGLHQRMLMIERKEKEMADYGDLYFRDKAEAQIAAFRRMEYQSKQGGIL